MARVLVTLGLVGALAACNSKGTFAAPDLSCGAHTCASSQTFNAAVCACVDAPDMTASAPADLGDTD